MSALASIGEVTALLGDLLAKDKPSPDSVQRLGTFFLQQIRRGLVTPGKLSSLQEGGDALTKTFEKRLEAFVHLVARGDDWLPAIAVAKERIRISLGRVTKENIGEASQERIMRILAKAAVERGKPLNGIDGLLFMVEVAKEADAGVLDWLATIQEVGGGLNYFYSQDDNAELGKRLSGSSAINAEFVEDIVRSRIDDIVSKELKKREWNKIEKVLNNMGNPLLVAEAALKAIRGSKDANEEEQVLQLLLKLMSIHGLEVNGYYPALYKALRDRTELSPQLLKISEISLRSRRLASTTQLPFLKLILRKCLYTSLPQSLFLLSLALNLVIMNSSLQLFFEPPFERDTFSLDMTFEESAQSSSSLRAHELFTLRGHHCKEIRTLATVLGNDMTEIQEIDLDDLIGIKDEKYLKMSLVRLKGAVFNPDSLETPTDATNHTE